MIDGEAPLLAVRTERSGVVGGFVDGEAALAGRSWRKRGGIAKGGNKCRGRERA